jgi:hypothetical protein
VQPVPDALKPPAPPPPAAKPESPAEPKSLLGEAADKGKEAKPVEGAPVSAAPEKYDFTQVKLPEGIALDQAAVDQFTPVFKEIGLTQEQANKLVAVEAARAQARAKADADNWKQQNALWQEETKKAFGPKLNEELAFVAKARNALVTPDLQADLDASGFSNRLPFLQFMAKIGRMVSEDNLVEGKAAHTGVSAKTLYPSMPNP